MHIFTTIAAVLILLGGVLYTKTSVISEPEQAEPQITQKSESNTPPQQASYEAYVYPGSQTVSAIDNAIVLTSDNPDDVTNWYKAKIKSQGMSVTSFVTTKTNNTVLNKLVGDDSNKKVEVEIKKNANDALVTITLSGW